MQRWLTRENNQADAALHAIADQPSPPGLLEKSAATIKPPVAEDYLNAINTIYDKIKLNKTPEELSEIHHYIFGDTKTSLSEIHADILKDVTAEIVAFISKQYDEPGENQRITSYCAAIKNKLVNSHQAQIDALEVSINSEIKAIMSDGFIHSAAEILQKYLDSRYAVILIFQQISAALYNAALDYYRSRWEASHTNLATLKKERETFNAIFNGIAQINDDFTITPYDINLTFLIKNGLKDAQKLLANQIKLARDNKLDTHKTSFAQLLGNLSAFNNEQQNPAGDYFNPVNSNDKKISIVFNERVHNAFQTYEPHKNRFKQVNPIDLDNVTRFHKDARKRITEVSFIIEENSRATLQTAKDNIELFKTYIQDEREILAAIMKLEFQIKPADEDIHALRTPTNKINDTGMPKNVALALVEAFNNGLLHHKLTATDAAEQIHQHIIRLKTDTNKIISDADSTAETLSPINTMDYLQKIKQELEQSEQHISQLLVTIGDAKKEQAEAADLLDKIKRMETAANNAEHYYQGFIGANQEENYFAGENDEQHPFSEAAKAITSLKSHRMTKELPPLIRSHIQQRERAFVQTRKNFSAILRCHLLMNSMMNLKYWKSIKDKNIALVASGKTYSIPQHIFSLIEIAQQPAHQNWATDPEVANRLLADIQFVASELQSTSAPVRAFLAAAAQADNTPIVFGGVNTVTRKMFLTPLRMIAPEEIHTIQKKPTWGEKHPIAKKVLIGLLSGFIALAVIALGIGIAMAFPPAAAALTGLAITISSAVGGTTIFGTLCGLAGAAIIGIGAGIGYIAGKISYARKQRQHQPVSSNPFVEAPAVIPRSKRPPPPSHPPRMPTQAEKNTATRERQPAASVSSSRFALHPTAASASVSPAIIDKPYFEMEIVREIINKYCGKPNEHDASPEMRATLIKLWETSRNNIETFLFELEQSRTITAKGVISEVVRNLNKKYPGLVETYPPNSLIRRRLAASDDTSQPAAKSVVMRRHG